MENKEILQEKASGDNEILTEAEEILEGSFDGILVTDGEGKVLYVNSSYERVAEIRKKDIEGRYMKDLINPIWMPNSVAYVVAEQKKPVSMRQIVKSGRHIIVTGRPILDKKGGVKRIVINARDITEIYQLTEELQRSKELGKMYMQRYSADEMRDSKASTSSVLAVSSEMREILSLAERLANFQVNVLILGESGVGKEEVAKHIHRNGSRSSKPFIAVNCGAIPSNLLESELFGYEDGAFTGAKAKGKKGMLEVADGGTVFLDEIGETPLDFQVKLLRFLETRELRRVGAVENKYIDVRVIAATNRDLAAMVEDGTFREDLFYRLNVVQINVPPLRKRTNDILPLATLFLNRYNERYNQEKMLTNEVVKELELQTWPGNVRQLKNTIENMVVVSCNDYLQTEDLPWVAEKIKNPAKSMAAAVADKCCDMSISEAKEELEKLMIKRAKEMYGSTREMAGHLGIDQSTVVRRMKKYNIHGE